jgi:hypothetical protein
MKQISARMTGTEIQIEMEIQALRLRIAELEHSMGELRAMIGRTDGVGEPEPRA